MIKKCTCCLADRLFNYNHRNYEKCCSKCGGINYLTNEEKIINLEDKVKDLEDKYSSIISFGILGAFLIITFIILFYL